MIKDYSKGKDDNTSLHLAIDWDKVCTISLNKEEAMSSLELEDKNTFVNSKGQIKEMSKIHFSKELPLNLLFPSRKIYIKNKEVWILKVNGDIIVRSENYKEIKSNYDHFYNEWKESKKKLKSSIEPS